MSREHRGNPQNRSTRAWNQPPPVPKHRASSRGAVSDSAAARPILPMSTLGLTGFNIGTPSAHATPKAANIEEDASLSARTPTGAGLDVQATPAQQTKVEEGAPLSAGAVSAAGRNQGQQSTRVEVLRTPGVETKPAAKDSESYDMTPPAEAEKVQQATLDNRDMSRNVCEEFVQSDAVRGRFDRLTADVRGNHGYIMGLNRSIQDLQEAQRRSADKYEELRVSMEQESRARTKDQGDTQAILNQILNRLADKTPQSINEDPRAAPVRSSAKAVVDDGSNASARGQVQIEEPVRMPKREETSAAADDVSRRIDDLERQLSERNRSGYQSSRRYFPLPLLSLMSAVALFCAAKVPQSTGWSNVAQATTCTNTSFLIGRTV